MADLRETGLVLDPKYDSAGLITAVATDRVSGDVLMLAHMNAEALRLTVESGEAHFWSRSRSALWIEEKYPVTTGLLLGLTSTKEEIVNDISNLIDYVKKNSAIQEVILQNFRAKKNTLMRNSSEITNDLFLRIIATTRIYAPSHISLQVPPNLSPDITIFLKSGQQDRLHRFYLKGYTDFELKAFLEGSLFLKFREILRVPKEFHLITQHI